MDLSAQLVLAGDKRRLQGLSTLALELVEMSNNILELKFSLVANEISRTNYRRAMNALAERAAEIRRLMEQAGKAKSDAFTQSTLDIYLDLASHLQTSASTYALRGIAPVVTGNFTVPNVNVINNVGVIRTSQGPNS